MTDHVIEGLLVLLIVGAVWLETSPGGVLHDVAQRVLLTWLP